MVRDCTGKRVVLSISVCVLLAALTLVLMPPALTERLPQPLQDWVFDARLTVAPLGKKVVSLASGSPWNKRAYWDEYGETVQFSGEQSKIIGTLFRPPSPGTHSGILLLHGSNPEGRKLGMYRLLGKQLSSRGYYTLAVDQRGYGESEAVQSTEPPSATELIADVRCAVSHLASLPGVSADGIYIIGHSAGANLAVAVGLQDTNVLKIVAIGPSRRVMERAEAESAYFRRRVMRYERLREPIPAELYLQRAEALLIDNQIGHFSLPGHKPLLLIDGELESEEDQLFLRQLYDSITEPKNCVTLPNSDHYANVSNFGPLVIYDEPLINRLVEEIDTWLRED